MKKVVLIGDIVSSKEITNRGAAQRKINSALKKINQQNQSGLISPYTITLGDEFQAVYENADYLFYDIFKLIEFVSPIKVRFSLGLGSISTKINREMAIGMDGSAFHYARKGIEELKVSDKYLMNISGELKGRHSLAKNVLFHISTLVNDWNLNRLKILNLLMKEKQTAQIAKKLKISRAAVYKNIEAGDIYLMINILKDISDLINESTG
jgi:hypothetical protein